MQKMDQIPSLESDIYLPQCSLTADKLFTAELIIMTDITLHSETVFFLWLVASWHYPVWSAITTILEEHVMAAFTYTLKMETADSMPLQNKDNHLTNCMLSAQETRFLIFTTAKISDPD